MTMPSRPTKLVRILFPEALQTEESALMHPAREARRLGGAAPASPMLAVTGHAKTSLVRLERLASARGQSSSRAGTLLGQLFSIVRNVTTDLVMSAEKSYRGTILGMHHGMGVFHLLEDAAIVSGDQELADFCSEWLSVRAGLIAACERELAWFAQNPDVALTRAARKPLSRLGQASRVAAT